MRKTCNVVRRGLVMYSVLLLTLACLPYGRSQRSPVCGDLCHGLTDGESRNEEYLYSIIGSKTQLLVGLSGGNFSLNCQDLELKDEQLPSYPRLQEFIKVDIKRCAVPDVANTLRALNITSKRLRISDCSQVGLKDLRVSALTIEDCKREKAENELLQLNASDIANTGTEAVLLSCLELRDGADGLGQLHHLELSQVVGAGRVRLVEGLGVLRLNGDIPELAPVANGLKKLHVNGATSLQLPKLSSLKELSLWQTTLETPTWEVSTQIVNLIARNSKLTGIDRLPHLEKLQLTSMNLREMPALPSNLRDIDVSYNKLTSLPSLLDIPHLETLNAVRNSIKSLDASSLPSSLQILKLDSNKFTELTDRELNFSSPSLTAYFTNNNILTVRCSVCGRSGLRLIVDDETRRVKGGENLPGDISTTISTLDCPSPCICTPARISCINTKLKRIPHLPPSLQELILRGNELKNLPKLPSGLKVLDVRDNPLSSEVADALLSVAGEVRLSCGCGSLLFSLVGRENAVRLRCAEGGGLEAAVAACRAGAAVGTGTALGAAVGVSGILLSIVAGMLLFYYKNRNAVKRWLYRMRGEDWSLPYDVFVSYSEPGRDQALQMVEELTRLGLAVCCVDSLAPGSFLPAAEPAARAKARRHLIMPGTQVDGIRHPSTVQIVAANAVCDDTYTQLFENDPHFWSKLLRSMPPIRRKPSNPNKEEVYTIYK